MAYVTRFGVVSLYFGYCDHGLPVKLRSEAFFCDPPLPSNVDRGPKGIHPESPCGILG